MKARFRGVSGRLCALVLSGAAALLATEGALRLWQLARRGAATGQSEFSAALAAPHPRLGFALLPGAEARHSSAEFDVEVRIGANGFRQAAPPPVERTGGRRRLLLLGDSFTFGYGVAEADRFGERLASRFPDLEVVNLGVPGTGTDQHLLIYESAGAAYRADVVLLGYLPEHVRRNGAAFDKGKAKPRFELIDGVLTERAPPAPEERPAAPGRGPRAWLREHSELYQLARAVLRERLGGAIELGASDPYPAYAADAPEWRVTRALFQRLRDRVAAGGGRLMIAVIPEPWHLRDAARGGHQAQVLAACRELGIEALDLTPAFLLAARESGEPLYFARDGHWTPRGHMVAASALERIAAPR